MPKGYRVLVTNDDGIHSPGLAVAEKIARALSGDVWVVAPENEQSGASHSLTLTSPLRLRRIEEQDRKSTRLNSSHQIISYAVFCLKKKNTRKHKIQDMKTR